MSRVPPCRDTDSFLALGVLSKTSNLRRRCDPPASPPPTNPRDTHHVARTARHSVVGAPCHLRFVITLHSDGMATTAQGRGCLAGVMHPTKQVCCSASCGRGCSPRAGGSRQCCMPAILRARRSCESPERGRRGVHPSGRQGWQCLGPARRECDRFNDEQGYSTVGGPAVHARWRAVEQNACARVVACGCCAGGAAAARRPRGDPWRGRRFLRHKGVAWLRQCVAQSHEFIALADDDAYVRLSSVVADLLLVRERGLSNVVYGGIEWYTFDRRRAFT